MAVISQSHFYSTGILQSATFIESRYIKPGIILVTQDQIVDNARDEIPIKKSVCNLLLAVGDSLKDRYKPGHQNL